MEDLPFPGCRWKRRGLGEGSKKGIGKERLGEKDGGGCGHDVKKKKVTFS